MHLNSALRVFAIILIASYNASECDCSQYAKITDKIYFDVSLDGTPIGRIIFGLFGEEAPRTVENFKILALEGIEGRSYKGTNFLIAVQRVMILGGDIVNNDGTGSTSIYGDFFEDENLDIKHESSGILAMANFGSANSNGCMFYITTMATPWLDGKNVVFGKVITGHEVLHKIEHLKTDINDRLLADAKITNCGQIPTEPYVDKTMNYEVTLMAWLKAGAVPLTVTFVILIFLQFVMKQLNKYESFR